MDGRRWVVAGLVLSGLPGAMTGACRNRDVRSLPQEALAGFWYMGTMTGRDCNLEIKADGTLRLRTGGCFHQDPPIVAHWRMEGERVLVTGNEATALVGPWLDVGRAKGPLVLVPRLHREQVRREGPRLSLCFWRNALGAGGLEAPAEAKTFR